MSEPVHPAEQRARLIKRLQKDIDREAQGGIVYFIQCGNLVKIGFTTNLPQRFRQVQTYAPRPPELLLSVLGKAELEKWFHWLFADYRSHGEWFHLSGPVRKYVERCGCYVF